MTLSRFQDRRYSLHHTGMERPVLIKNPEGATVAIVHTDEEPGDQYKVAPLFAAAPAMLVMLQKITSRATRGVPDSTGQNMVKMREALINEARELLSAIEGERK